MNSISIDESSTNVTIESKTTQSKDLLYDDTQSSSITGDSICTRLTSDDSSIENRELLIPNDTDKMSQREKKMRERWSAVTNTDKNNNEQSSKKTLLGVQFPPVSVLRRKFSPSSPSSASSSTRTTNKQTKNKIDMNSDKQLNLNLLTIIKVSKFISELSYDFSIL